MIVWSYLPSIIVISENKIHHTFIQAELIKQGILLNSDIKIDMKSVFISTTHRLFMYQIFISLLTFSFRTLYLFSRSKKELMLENILLRQQLAAYQAKKERPKNITDITRSYLIALMDNWPDWKRPLVIVQPATVISWQKKRFKNHWSKISNRNKKPGRKPKSKEIKELILRMARENINWGAPRIYSELLMLGYSEKDISERTISRYLKKFRPEDPEKIKKKQQQWQTFIQNHRKHIMGMDFFTVPTVGLKVLHVFFIIDHSRRRLVHFNTTSIPTEKWVIQQLKNAFPFATAPKYLFFDRGSVFSSKVKKSIKDMGTKPVQIGYRSPWQNGVAERFVLSVRNDLLDHVIIFNEEHLRSLMKQYVEYYNNDRCHLSVGRDSPKGRKVLNKDSESGKIIAFPKLGGLHHKYEWKKAA